MNDTTKPFYQDYLREQRLIHRCRARTEPAMQLLRMTNFNSLTATPGR